MSYFDKFVFKTFLFLALACFSASSAFADVTFKWYQSENYIKCDLTAQTICNYTVTGFGYNPNYTYSTCRENGTSVEVARKQKTSTWVDGVETINFVDNGYVYTGSIHNLTCPDNSTIVLRGCTAECIQDPCTGLKDQEFSGNGECGSFTCPNGGVLVSTSTSSYCSKGTPTVNYSPPQLGVNTQNSCAGVYKSHTNNASVEKTLSGVTGGSFYCSATFTYTGKTGVAVPDKNLNALTGGATPMPEDGICKDPTPLSGMLNGTPVCYPNELPDSPCPISNEKPNSNGVCVAPDDPTYPKDTDPTKPDPKTGCDAGKIRNNAGVCVPYADAGKCPTGQIKDSAGASCINDPKANSCPTGQVKNKTTGSCSNDPRGTGCANNQLPDKLGMCPDGSASCAVGKIRNASGVCVGSDPTKPPEGTGCKDGSTPNSSGVCSDGSASCPAGKVRGSDGKCALDTTESNTTGTASSDCDVAPDCGGDPLQCATLEQIWRSSCEQTKAFSETSKEDAEKMASAATASQAEYDAHQAAIDSQATGFFSEFESKASSVSASGQCINDLSVPVMGHSMVIPFSQACDFFRFLRILVLFSAYMLAARIIFGGLT